MVLSDSGAFFTEEERRQSGEVTQPASGMVRALRQAGFPVTVVSEGDMSAVGAMAARARPDHIVAVSVYHAHGLERPVVVYVAFGNFSDITGRLFAMSRATASLLWVRRPPT
jgi:phosphoserine phosphatase